MYVNNSCTYYLTHMCEDVNLLVITQFNSWYVLLH